MDELRRLEAKSLARAKLRAKRRRTRAIRARAIVGSVVLFAIAWAIVFGQLVTGNDPVLSRADQNGRPVARAAPAARPAAEPEPEAAPEPAPVVTAAS